MVGVFVTFLYELLQQVTRLHGVRPSIRYAEIAELVDHSG